MSTNNNRASSDAITRDFFDSLLVEMRCIDSDIPSTEYELYGKSFATPIMTAALSHLNNTCENGMVEFAKGAKAADAVHWAGMGSLEELENIIATGAHTVKIIKPHADNDEVFRRIEHAVKNGAFAVGMDIDHAFNGSGDYDCVIGLPMKPKTFDELAEFVKAAGDVPFIVKGVLSVSDAEKCVKAGAKGILLSHHHGIMDYAVPPLMILPEVLKAVGGEIPVFVDCGIESGMDAFKALALGASAVCVGRYLMEPLRSGADGVKAKINEINGQLKAVMARTGMKSLADMSPDVIRYRNF